MSNRFSFDHDSLLIANHQDKGTYLYENKGPQLRLIAVFNNELDALSVVRMAAALHKAETSLENINANVFEVRGTREFQDILTQNLQLYSAVKKLIMKYDNGADGMGENIQEMRGLIEAIDSDGEVSSISDYNDLLYAAQRVLQTVEPAAMPMFKELRELQFFVDKIQGVNAGGGQ